MSKQIVSRAFANTVLYLVDGELYQSFVENFNDGLQELTELSHNDFP